MPDTLYTTHQAAALLGITRWRVTQLIHARNLGTKHGRDWLLSESDIDAMRVRIPGRPTHPPA